LPNLYESYITPLLKILQNQKLILRLQRHVERATRTKNILTSVKGQKQRLYSPGTLDISTRKVFK
jgi:hypothetical protein